MAEQKSETLMRPLGQGGPKTLRKERKSRTENAASKSKMKEADPKPDSGSQGSVTANSSAESVAKTMTTTRHDSVSSYGDHRGSPSPRNKADFRRRTALTYDIVVQKESEPSFVADLHDLTKQKIDARDVLLNEAVSDDSKKERSAIATEKKPRRRHTKSASANGTPDEEREKLRRFGVRIGNKLWVPTTVNPLEIDLRKSQIKELKEVFELMENPSTGMVCVDDIQAVVRAYGSQPTALLIGDILNRIEPTQPGYLTPEEFEDILRFGLQEKSPVEDIERAFKNMSRSKTERVGLEDLREVSKLVDYPLTDDELMEMINATCPASGAPPNEATLGGFVRLMTSTNWYDTPAPSRRNKPKSPPLKQNRIYRHVGQTQK